MSSTKGALAAGLLTVAACAARSATPAAAGAHPARHGWSALVVKQRMGEARAPTFSLTIEADGTVTWKGTTCVGVLGTRQRRLDAQTLAAVDEALHDANLASLPPFSPAFETAMVSPLVTIVVRHDRSEREVQAIAEFAPPRLLALEDRLLKLAGVGEWVPSWRAPPRERCSGAADDAAR